MEQKENGMQGLQFIFTEKDFYLERQIGADRDWGKRFEQERYRALYQLGFAEISENMTATGRFLSLVSSSFLDLLTSLPELEVARKRSSRSCLWNRRKR